MTLPHPTFSFSKLPAGCDSGGVGGDVIQEWASLVRCVFGGVCASACLCTCVVCYLCMLLKNTQPATLKLLICPHHPGWEAASCV